MTPRNALALVVAIVLVALTGACSTDQSSSASTITVTMTDTKIALSETSIAAGTVTFNVLNSGTTVHSLVLLRSDLAHDKIPVDQKDPSKVQETGSIAATGQMGIGTSKQVSRQLVAGQYVLVCNEPAHYIVGMHTALVVK